MLIGVFAACVPAGEGTAHTGRRFTVEAIGGKIQAQGINFGLPDGLPFIRPYVNSLHDHWRNVEGLEAAVASLPGFDVPFYATPLVGNRLEIELLSVQRWVDPPLMPPPGTVPRLEPLDPGSTVSLTGPSGEITSTELGVLELSGEVPTEGLTDVDLIYQIETKPVGEIYVFEYQLRATPVASGAAHLQPSDSIYVLLSPDGADPSERLHHASLYLEQYVTTIPEPASMVLMACGMLGVVGAFRRKCRAGVKP